MEQELRRILAKHGKLAVPVETLTDTTNLFGAGLDSLAIVNVMLAIENAFDIEFPDEELKRSTFASIAAMKDAISRFLPVQS